MWHKFACKNLQACRFFNELSSMKGNTKHDTTGNFVTVPTVKLNRYICILEQYRQNMNFVRKSGGKLEYPST